MLGGDEDGASRGPVALVALVPDPEGTGAVYQRIALASYQKREITEFLTPPSRRTQRPLFSPDRLQLVFESFDQGSSHAPRLVLLDLESKRPSPLLVVGAGGESDPLFGSDPVWSLGGGGFYYNLFNPFGAESRSWSYNLSDSTKERVGEDIYSLQVLADLGEGTLLVFAGGESVRNGIYTYRGGAIAPVGNPYLAYVNSHGINTQVAFSFDWEPDLGLLVFAQHDSSLAGSRIMESSLDGDHLVIHTSGTYWDDNPRWGPNGNTILFDRRAVEDRGPASREVLEIDRRSGSTRSFASSNKIAEVLGVRSPDY
ncbi:MAG: hypothetical protein ACI80V_001348 [Rhodothermales bacterium]|jgi:hypothetical protein